MNTTASPIRSQKRTKAVIAGSILYMVFMSLVTIIGLDVSDTEATLKSEAARNAAAPGAVEMSVRGHAVGEPGITHGMARSNDSASRLSNVAVPVRGRALLSAHSPSTSISPVNAGSVVRVVESVGTRGHIQTISDAVIVASLAPKSTTGGFEPLPTLHHFFGTVDHARPPEEQRELLSYLNAASVSIEVIPTVPSLLSNGLASRLPICQPTTILRV